MSEEDKELLRLASIAACVDNDYQRDDGTIVTAGECPSFWNPLTDDGDALRLAIKLRLMWVYGNVGSEEHIHMYALRTILTPRPKESMRDGYYAVRRAIVKTAAEIGKKKK